jgi:hypothetical protein
MTNTRNVDMITNKRIHKKDDKNGKTKERYKKILLTLNNVRSH